MSFFLLGKYPDDRLTLLSELSFSTRQEAMSELSRLTATPEFDAWEAEVLVVDSDLGTPVLLVRPSAPGTSSDETGEDALQESAVVAADERACDSRNLKRAVVLTEPPADEPEDEPDAALAAVMLDLGMGGETTTEAAPDKDAAVEAETTPTEAEPSEAEPDEAPTAETDASEDSFLGESDEPVEVVDTAWADAVLESADASKDNLKGALKRTAVHMESEGISAPESVGPAGAAVEELTEESELSTDVGAPERDVVQPEAVGDPQPAKSPVEESAPADETEAVADTEVESADSVADTEVESAEAEPDETELLDATEPPVSGWPWDAPVEPETTTDTSIADEPADDDESMIRALADDDASRTVVLGEYAVDEVAEEKVSPQAKAPDPDPSAAEEPADSLVEIEPASPSTDAEPAVEKAQPVEQTPPSEPEPEPEAEEESTAASDADDSSQETESDFVDLGEVAPEPVAKAYEPGDVDMDEMTCDDCVYVDTCPNKDEREPKTCGSFQWK